MDESICDHYQSQIGNNQEQLARFQMMGLDKEPGEIETKLFSERH
jgi:hypothetical protein